MSHTELAHSLHMDTKELLPLKVSEAAAVPLPAPICDAQHLLPRRIEGRMIGLTSWPLSSGVNWPYHTLSSEEFLILSCHHVWNPNALWPILCKFGCRISQMELLHLFQLKVPKYPIMKLPQL